MGFWWMAENCCLRCIRWSQQSQQTHPSRSLPGRCSIAVSNPPNSPELKNCLQMGCYQEGIAKDSVAGKDVTAHIFEYNTFTNWWDSITYAAIRYTTNVVVTDKGEVGTGSCPIQVVFCLKEQNKKKLNSHRWFFNAFGPLIQPNSECYRLPYAWYKLLRFDVLVCVLLDVGTKPTGTSIYELWKCE